MGENTATIEEYLAACDDVIKAEAALLKAERAAADAREAFNAVHARVILNVPRHMNGDPGDGGWDHARARIRLQDAHDMAIALDRLCQRADGRRIRVFARLPKPPHAEGDQ